MLPENDKHWQGIWPMKPLREPMLHFIVAGAMLFAANAVLDRGSTTPDQTDPVQIGEGEIRWLRETFANQWRRAPTSEELSGLVASLVEEELLAREARATGLDQGDTIVRRRLAQKLSFLVEDTSRIAEPTDDDLQRFYAANIDRFRTEPRVSFAQIFFSTERRRHAEAALVSISAPDGGGDLAVLGDSLLLEESFRGIDRQALSSIFGADFAEAVFGLKPGSWHGPISSGFGLHLVEVTNVSLAEPRPFAAVRSEVAEEWRRERQSTTKASYLAELREKYGVVIENGIKPLLTPEAIGNVMQ